VLKQELPAEEQIEQTRPRIAEWRGVDQGLPLSMLPTWPLAVLPLIAAFLLIGRTQFAIGCFGIFGLYASIYAWRYRKVNQSKNDLLSQLHQDSSSLGLSYAANVRFCYSKTHYASDRGLLILTEDALIFDGEQTTFSVPLGALEIGLFGDSLVASFRSTRFLLRFSLPELFLDAKVVELKGFLSEMRKPYAYRRDVFLPPLIPDERIERRRKATVWIIGFFLLQILFLQQNWFVVLPLLGLIAMWAHNRSFKKLRQKFQEIETDPNLAFEAPEVHIQPASLDQEE
jgi:hypothetical protein